MRHLQFLLLFGLLYSPSLAQQPVTEGSTPYALTGLINPRQVGDLLIAEASSNPVFEAVGLIEVNKEAKNVVVNAWEIGTGKVIEPRQLKEKDGSFVTPPAYAIEIPGSWMVVLFGDSITGKRLYPLVVGKPDPVVIKGCMDPKALNYNPKATVDDCSCKYPVPPPSPIPSDRFGNLGQRVDLQADTMTLPQAQRLQLSEVYNKVALMMRGTLTSPQTLFTGPQIQEEVIKQKNALSLGPTWDAFSTWLKQDLASRNPWDWDSYIDAYRAIALGLKG